MEVAPKPKGGGPEGWGPRWKGGARNFALFFLVPPQNSFFSSFSGGVLVEFWWCFEAPGRSNVHVWSSRVVVCEPRRPGLVGPLGFHTTARHVSWCHTGGDAPVLADLFEGDPR